MNARITMPFSRRIAGATVAGFAVLSATTLTACTSNNDSAAATVTVSASDETCELSATAGAPGSFVFAITNTGTQVNEFYVYGADGVSIVAEVENVGPGLSRELVVSLSEGTYVTACDPGMDDSELRADFVVSGAAIPEPSGADAEALALASETYLAYVRTEVSTLVTKTESFAEAFAAGDDDAAREQYADARVHWERIEPVAEAFGDLDPRLDLREADLGPQEAWTGWHKAEKALWPPLEGFELTADDRAALAEQLVADTIELADRVNAADFAIEPFQIGNGAKELLDEVASSKITGEEEIWSGTDLWDMQANIDGARAAYETLRPLVEQKDPALVETLDSRFDAVEELLAAYGSYEEGFVAYGELTEDQVLALSRAIEGLGEPLSQLTAAAVL